MPYLLLALMITGNAVPYENSEKINTDHKIIASPAKASC